MGIVHSTLRVFGRVLIYLINQHGSSDEQVALHRVLLMSCREIPGWKDPDDVR
jgi:hypothetical protein